MCVSGDLLECKHRKLEIEVGDDEGKFDRFWQSESKPIPAGMNITDSICINVEGYLVGHWMHWTCTHEDACKFDGESGVCPYVIKVITCNGCRHTNACTDDPAYCGYWSDYCVGCVDAKKDDCGHTPKACGFRG